MSPVALGDLPSNEPVPTGRVSLKRGASNSGVVCPPNNSIMYDGPGSPWPMYVYVDTGSRPGWWIIRAENIFILSDAAWYYFAWYVRLDPPDADGVSIEYGHHRLHSALGWQQSCIDAAFRLNPNTHYEATMYFRDRQAGTVSYFTGPDYCTIGGEFIAEGSL
jgi:hypothetical protein